MIESLCHIDPYLSKTLGYLSGETTPLPKSFGSNTSACEHDAEQKLLNVRVKFIYNISQSTLKVVQDKLLQMKVLTSAEYQAVEFTQHTDKARDVIDTVTKKGGEACSKMIQILCETDQSLSKTIGLM